MITTIVLIAVAIMLLIAARLALRHYFPGDTR